MLTARCGKIRQEIVPKLTPGGASPAPTGCPEIVPGEGARRLCQERVPGECAREGVRRLCQRGCQKIVPERVSEDCVRRGCQKIVSGEGARRLCQEIADALSHGGGTRTEAIPAARAA